jgi:hypothetical protein
MANKEQSLRRASLMRELCGNDTLRYPTDICAMEIERALSNDQTNLTLKDIFSSKDEWFGIQFDTNSLKEQRKNAEKEINASLEKLPRAQRRKFKSQLDLSKASSKPIYRRLIKDGHAAPSTTHDPLLRLIDPDLFVDWFLREKSDEDVQEHIRRLLTDPYVLFGHVVDRTGHREQLYNIARGAGEKLATSLETVGQSLVKLFELSNQAGIAIKPRELAETLVSEQMIKSILVSLSSRPLDGLNASEIKGLGQRFRGSNHIRRPGRVCRTKCG